jgi:hypothetical protein
MLLEPAFPNSMKQEKISDSNSFHNGKYLSRTCAGPRTADWEVLT